MKILQVVGSKEQRFYVLDEAPVLLYTRKGDIITGTDGIFYNCYFHHVDRYAKAFAGRSFDIPLVTGEVIHATGEWWDSHYPDIPLASTPYGTISRLKNCYVFYSLYADIKKFKKLLKEYKGTVIDYWEYEKMLKAL